MKRNYLILSLVALMATSAVAETRSRKEAETIAIEHAQRLGIQFNNKQLRRCVIAGQKEENAPYYVFNNGDERGWTIVSGDDRTSAVLAYSTEGDFDWQQMPAPVQEMFTNFEKNITTMDDAHIRTLAPRKTGTQTKSAIGPLLITKWDQYEPYSGMTPVISGKQCATCCVAVGFAQILYYLYYTQAAQDSTTFQKSIPAYTRQGYQVTGAKAGPRTYNWSDMLTDYVGKTYTQKQADAVAKLMVDVGCALQVKYGDGGTTSDSYFSSTTNSGYVQQYGINYFGLDASASYTSTPASLDAYFTAVDKELNTYHPVLVAGSSHAFVCDGRDASGVYYHFNFGYDGRGDGFYSQDAYNGYGTQMHITTGLRIAGEPATPTTAREKLKVKYNAAYAVAANDSVGNTPGFYREANYRALQQLMDQAKAVINGETTMSDDEMLSLGEEISEAEQKMVDYRTPYYTGTYYLKSVAEHGTTDVAMYVQSSGLYYGPINKTSNYYKWELTYNEETNGYTIKNVGSGKYINSISDATKAMGTDASICCEMVPTNRIEDGNTRYKNDYWSISYANTIRPMVSGYKDTSHGYISIYNADGRKGVTSGSLMGWQPYDDWDVWVPVPIDVNPAPEASLAYDVLNLQIGETATNELTTNSTGRVGYSSSNTAVAKVNPTGVVTAVDAGTAIITVSIGKTDEYSATSLSYTVNVAEDAAVRQSLDSLLAVAGTLYTDEELKAAQAAVSEHVSDGLITNYTQQFTSPYTEKSEGAITNLNDDNAATFWHSAWSGGSVASGTHYFEVALNEALTSEILIRMTRRSNATDDHVTQFVIYSSADGTTYGAEGATVDFPYGSSDETVEGRFTPCDNCKKLKFVCTATTSSRGYFHMGEFQLYSVTYSYPTEAQQALIVLAQAVEEAKATSPAHQSDVDALQAAIDAYKVYVIVDDVHDLELVRQGTLKYLRNGRFFIRKDGNEYNASGLKVVIR